MPVEPAPKDTQTRVEGARSVAADTQQSAQLNAGTLLTMSDAAEYTQLPVQALWIKVQEGQLTVHRVRQDGRSVTAVDLAQLQSLLPNAAGASAEPEAAQESGSVAAGEPIDREAPASAQAAQDFFVPRPDAALAPEAHQRESEEPGGVVHDPLALDADAIALDAERALSEAAEAAAASLREEEQKVLRDELEEQRNLVTRLRSEVASERGARSTLEGRLAERQRIEDMLNSHSEDLVERLRRAEDALEEQKRESMTLARALGQAEGQVLMLQGRTAPPTDERENENES